MIGSDGLCVDVYGNSGSAGAAIDQRPCKNTAGTNQDFTPR
ncbi:hypothetical protein ACFYOD_02690 [Streptomyces sp. NPDC006703]